VKYWVHATGEFPVVSEDDMLRKTINESSEPVVGRLGVKLIRNVAEGVEDVLESGSFHDHIAHGSDKTNVNGSESTSEPYGGSAFGRFSARLGRRYFTTVNRKWFRQDLLLIQTGNENEAFRYRVEASRLQFQSKFSDKLKSRREFVHGLGSS
jgi:hypothetical protein